MPYRTFHIRHRPSYADVIRNCCIDQYASDVFITDIPSCTLCITLCSSNNTFNQILLACESLHASYATSCTLPACRATEQLSHCSVLTGYTGGYLATSSSIWISKIQICYVPSSTKGMYVCICIRHEAHMNRRLRSTERQTNNHGLSRRYDGSHHHECDLLWARSPIGERHIRWQIWHSKLLVDDGPDLRRSRLASNSWMRRTSNSSTADLHVKRQPALSIAARKSTTHFPTSLRWIV